MIEKRGTGRQLILTTRQPKWRERIRSVVLDCSLSGSYSLNQGMIEVLETMGVEESMSILCRYSTYGISKSCYQSSEDLFP